MYPPIEPFNSGYLSVGDGNEIFWETSGNPKGQPALFLHGGPGGGIKTGYRRRFDPEKFMVVSFEQRGCGRSRPLATDSLSDLKSNTTQNLISDIEKLRSFFNIEKWLITGGSWGTTLALAYAQAHANRVVGLVLAAVTTTTEFEVSWITESMAELFPNEWDRFKKAVDDMPGTRLIDKYYEAIRHPDQEVRLQVAKAWCEWEDVHPSLDPNYTSNPDFKDPKFCLQFSTLVIHYWKHSAFLKSEQILTQMNLISHIPGILIHGRYDVSSPMRTAWRLHQSWKNSELIIIDDEGHGGPKMMGEMALAISRIGLRKEQRL
jgi:proline iminopeptidase